jgi:hypothetical protein
VGSAATHPGAGLFASSLPATRPVAPPAPTHIRTQPTNQRIVLAAEGLQYSSSVKARYISLLRLLRLGRAYRLKKWAVFLTNNANISLLLVTIVRNVLIAFFTTHISGCLFYYIARQTEGMSWMQAAGDWLPGGTNVGTFEKYIYSL